jgi:hypothetical protein
MTHPLQHFYGEILKKRAAIDQYRFTYNFLHVTYRETAVAQTRKSTADGSDRSS